MAAEPVSTGFSPDEFSALLGERFSQYLQAQNFAVALSGGPDSMVLAKLLTGWAQARGNIIIHALTVDHGLRAESKSEAEQVGQWVKDWPGLRHHILTWEGEKPQNRVQEEARNARYGLMSDYCLAHDIACLFLAHHQDDQGETFLLRLAMGSGLDGLAAMRAVQPYGAGLVLLRPLLGISKQKILETAVAGNIPFVTDPSNQSENFARVRLRKSLAALEAEGLSAKRLAMTAERLERARQALDEIAEKAELLALLEKNTDRIIYKYGPLMDWPEEVILRVLIRAMKILRPQGEHLPRMEKIESLFRDFLNPAPFTKRTLGGLIFERDDREKTLIIRPENMDKNTV